LQAKTHKKTSHHSIKKRISLGLFTPHATLRAISRLRARSLTLSSGFAKSSEYPMNLFQTSESQKTTGTELPLCSFFRLIFFRMIFILIFNFKIFYRFSINCY
jgi:hypothetical protein